MCVKAVKETFAGHAEEQNYAKSRITHATAMLQPFFRPSRFRCYFCDIQFILE
jgi:hypothetical protein